MILSQAYLKMQGMTEFAQTSQRKEQIKSGNACLFIVKKKYDIFLSHSYLDKDLVYVLVSLFNMAGYCVYVDWMVDTQLDRSMVNDKTASFLRERMKSCRGLAYIATTNISLSKWCPWELGYVDGNKNGRCAILPVLGNNASTFKGQEYLGIYPYIDYAQHKNSQKYDFWVNDPDNADNYVSLKDWLDGTDLK